MHRCLVCLSLFALLASNVAAREFYVSPSGDDAHPGTKQQPFRSLERARDAVRQINATMTGDIVVYLAGGEYRLVQPVTFTPTDSGRDGHKIIYTAVAGQTPVITGGLTVSGWQVHHAKNNIYRAPLDVGLFRQLYIDNTPAIRARTPNRISEMTRGPYWPSKVSQKPTTRVRKEHWQACEKVPTEKLDEVEMVMVCHWYHQRIRIGRATVDGDEVAIVPVRPEGKFNKQLRFYQNNRGMKNPFYFENALAFVDVPLEWYYDPDDRWLYLALGAGEKPDGRRIEIPVNPTLISIRGSADAPVRDIEFRGLTFQITNWSSPSRRGVNMTQAAQVVGGEQPTAMLDVKHVRAIGVRHCVFRNAGGHGIGLFDADATDIQGNQFYRIAANGIDIDRGAGRNPTPDRQSVDVAVWNNQAKQCGDHYANGIFLLAGNVRGLVVEHNLIHDMPYSGMQIGQQPGKMQDVGCGQNRIRFNHVHHCVQIHGDGGGIYTLGGIQRGSVIARNYVHDIHQSPLDHYKVDHIYLDNFTSAIEVWNNVVKGGRVAERNGSSGNSLMNNTQADPEVERNAGVKAGYDARQH
jgi:hypothetical protein